MIYLDNAATSFPKPEEVYRIMDKINRELSVNAGRGSYKAAKKASELINEAKENIKDLFNCKMKADIVFTPSVTHAFNQVLNGLDISRETVIYISEYEHNAVARTVEAIQKRIKCSVEFLPLEENSFRIDVNKTKYLFCEKQPDIVVMNLISNVTGYRLPMEEVFAAAKSSGAITIADAAQAAGLIDVDMDRFNADIICFAGHKTLCGPFGIGGFAIRKGVVLDEVITGGTGSNSLVLSMPVNAPERYEAGSPNIVAIAGLNEALKWLKTNKHEERIKKLSSYLLEELDRIKTISICGMSSSDECYGIVSFVVENYHSDDVGSILDDEFDIAVRTGYHCAPYIHKYIGDIAYAGTVRVGIGPFNTKKDIDMLINALKTL